jgi:alkylhydroperoxidase family enzyme
MEHPAMRETILIVGVAIASAMTMHAVDVTWGAGTQAEPLRRESPRDVPWRQAAYSSWRADASVTGADDHSENRRSSKDRRSSRPVKPRIAPVQRADWTEAQRQILEPFEQQARLHNVFTTMANHPDLARDWLTFASHVLRRNTLPARDREVLILRIGWLCDAEYEWAQHVRIGKSVGLTDDDIRLIGAGPGAEGLNAHDRLLVTAADELHEQAMVSDKTWSALTKVYDTRQMMDLVFTVGEYNLVSMALNSFGVQLDEGFEGFPK